MRFTASRLLATLVFAGLLSRPSAAQAQRALVFCPVTIDATGCNAVTAALTAGTQFPGGVDTGFDGTNGTVDLATGDLSSYSVLVIPSLADGGGVTPYALLRDPTVGARLRSIFVGRLAVWSGSPDIGSTNRAAKDGLIRNLAVFARADSANTHGPGLVVLQDNSDDGARYDWLAGISGIAVTADTTFEFYSNVDVLTPTGRGILTNSSGLQIGYTNMASFGLFPPSDGTPVSQDARGGRTTRLVLLTTAGEPGAPLATVITDREDYPPGDTVVVTGTGWEPGEVVSMLLHEEPAVHSDRTLTAVADSAGNIFNDSFVLGEDDLGVRFVLTAVGQTSGRSAQTTFTDDRQITAATVAGGSSVTVQVGQAITASVTVNTTNGAGGGNAWASTSWTYATTAPSGTFNSPCADTPDHAAVATFTESFATTAPTVPGTYNAYFLAWRTASCGNNASTLFSLANAVTVTQGATTTALASGTNASVFGQSVTFTATVAPVSPAGGNPLGTVAFKEGTTTLGTGSLVCAATCTATFSTATLGVGSHTLTAVYGGNASYTTSTSTSLNQVVNKANTITTVTGPTTSVFGQTLTFNATVSGGGVGTPTGQVQFRVDGTNLSTPVTLSGGNATSPTVSGLAVGSHSLTAEYLSDPSFNGSPSGPFAHAVNKAGTTTTITADTPDPSNSGQAVAVSFTVVAAAPGSGTPTGNVSVTASGGPETCTGTVATGSCSITLTVPGPRTLTATYAGDGSFTTSASAGAAHTVNAAATSLTVAPASGTFGGTAALSATLTSGGNPVVGVSVSFTLNGNPAGSATTNGSGVASIGAASLGTINAGTYPTGVGASFAGTTAFAASSGSASLTVAPTPTTLTLQGTPTSVVYGGTATFGAKLSESSNGHVISLLIDGNAVGTDATNNGGNAMITVNFASFPTIGVGPHTVQASFAGETNLAASSSTTANFNVTAAAATVTLSTLSHTYDGTPKSAIATTSPSGLTVSLTYNGSATPPTDAGSYAVVATVTDANHTGTATGTLVIAPLALTGHFTADNKVYDGTTAAAILTRTLTGGVVSGDAVSLTGGTATFDSKNVGTGKTVTGTGFALSGGDQANYTLASPTLTTTADVTTRDLTVTATAQSRPYDGTTAAVVSLSDDRVSGDIVTVSYTSATFADKHVGTGKTVTVSGLSLAGTDGGNYALTGTTATATADITALTLAPQFTAADKMYDGTTAASIVTRSASGTIITNDQVSVVGGTAQFDTRHAGAGKTVTASGFTLTGSDAGNYLLNPTTASTTASVSRRPITVTAAADTKTYDGTTSSSATPTVTTGSIVAGDEGAFTQAFDSKHVGTGKTLTPAGSVDDDNSGADYLITFAESHNGVIQAKALVGSIAAQNKTYDGTDAATIATRTLSGVIESEDVSYIGGTATFDNRNAGTGKTVTATGLSLDGGDAGNYTVNPTATTTANITRRPIEVTASTDSKTYDGTTASAETPTITEGTLVGGDSPAFTQSFDTKSAGTGKTLTPVGLVNDGNSGANYLVSFVPVHTGTILQRALAVTASAQDKVYDGTTAATVSLSDDRLGGDVFTVNHTSAVFGSKTVGNGKTVTVSGLSLTGTDAGNYALAGTTVTTTADIMPVTLTAHFTAANKVYDGTTAANILTRTLGTGVISGDDVTLTGGSATFSDKNVANGKTVTANGFTLAGGDAENYVLDPAAATATADITVRTLVVTTTGQDKVYDATTAAAVALHDDRVTGDQLTLSHGPATFADKNVGDDKTITVPGIAISGTDAGNYELASTGTTATADITHASLQPVITASNKIYDGNTTATIVTRSLAGVLLTDVVTLESGTASFADANAGMGKSVTGSGFTLAGTDAGNYILNPSSAQTTANIDRRPITVTADPGQSKVYGTTPDPALTWQITAGSLVSGESLAGLLGRAPGETVAGSPYAITVGTLTGGPNYYLTFVSAGFSITRATLTVTAGNASKTYGDAVPTLSGTMVGVKFSDNISATYTAYVAAGGMTLVTASTPVAGSPYPIIPAVSGSPSAVLDNYTVVPVNGNLQVLEATPSFTSVSIPNVVFGQGSSTVSGTIRYAGTGATVIPTGSVAVTVNGQSGTGTILANGTFTASVPTGSLPASGTGHTVTLSYNGSDPNFLPGSGTGVMKVLYNTSAGHQFLQPINPNLTTGNRSSFKIGSTIPTKFQIFKADGSTVVTTAVATIAVIKLDSNAETPINEDLLTTPADAGTTFRVSSGQYIYNLGTKNWTAGTYRIIANLDDGSQITAEVDGRAK
jgi:hypothetical protein